jgi:hypothetical protein
MPTLPLDRRRSHVGTVEQHAAAGIRPVERVDDAQHGGLAAAGGIEQHQGFAALDFERRRLERVGAVGKSLAAGLDPHRGAVPTACIHRFCPSSANICIATNSGTIMTKKIRV